MIIELNKKEYNIKYTLRGIFIFEQITGKSFSISNTMDEYLFFYSMLLANNKDTTLTFDEFIDILDEEPEKVKEFTDFLTATFKVNSQLSNKEEENEESGKN